MRAQRTAQPAHYWLRRNTGARIAQITPWVSAWFDARRVCTHDADEQSKKRIKGRDDVTHRTHVTRVLVDEEDLGDALGEMDGDHTRHQRLAPVHSRRCRHHRHRRDQCRRVNDRHTSARWDACVLRGEFGVAGGRLGLIRKRGQIEALHRRDGHAGG